MPRPWEHKMGNCFCEVRRSEVLCTSRKGDQYALLNIREGKKIVCSEGMEHEKRTKEASGRISYTSC